MGSFTWLRADKNISKNGQANICYGEKIKVLIPNEFGGGSIEGEYLDYGLVEEADGNQYDLHELVAIWNSPEIRNKLAELGYQNVNLKAVGEEETLDAKISDIIRNYGIIISCYDKDHAKIKFPLKLVDEKTRTAYEDCEYFSIGDPKQGFEEWDWEEFDEVMSYYKARNYENYMENLKVEGRCFSEEEIRNKLEDTLKKLDELKNERK